MRLDTALEMMPGLVIGLTLHECAHALTASWLGDRYAARQGRISLNPFRHLSFWGTLALFVLGFGWGKPVPVNLYNFRHPKRDFLLTSLAGPAVNLLVFAISLGLLSLDMPYSVGRFLYPCLVINGILAVINLIPIPPLDGSRIWPCLIPGVKPVISGKWSLIWLVVLVYIFSTHQLDFVARPFVHMVSSLTPGRNQPRPDNFPDILQVPDYAASHYTVWPQDSQPPKYYKISSVFLEPFPPEKWMESIRAPLQQQGWKPCTSQFTDPKLAIQPKWTSQPGSRGHTIYHWTEGWFHPDRGLALIRIRQTVSDPEKRRNLCAGTTELELFTPEYGDYRVLLRKWHQNQTNPPQEKPGS
jgi:Zn-dependent protease